MLVDFYHLSSLPLERVLPSICEKVLASGNRLLIVAESEALGRLDELLWAYAPDGFLPHARRDQPHPQSQPILLSDEAEPLNGATNLALADGLWREEALSFDRTFYFFDPARVEGARTAWRSLKQRSEVESRYWKSDDGGRWVQGP